MRLSKDVLLWVLIWENSQNICWFGRKGKAPLNTSHWMRVKYDFSRCDKIEIRWKKLYLNTNKNLSNRILIFKNQQCSNIQQNANKCSAKRFVCTVWNLPNTGTVLLSHSSKLLNYCKVKYAKIWLLNVSWYFRNCW